MISKFETYSETTIRECSRKDRACSGEGLPSWLCSDLAGRVLSPDRAYSIGLLLAQLTALVCPQVAGPVQQSGMLGASTSDLNPRPLHSADHAWTRSKSASTARKGH